MARCGPAIADFNGAAGLGPFAALLGDDVDHPGRGIGPEKRRLRAAQHFDAVHVGQLQPGQEILLIACRRADAVDQHQRVIALGPANADLGVAFARCGNRHAGHLPQRLFDGHDAALFKILRGQHGIGAAIRLRLNRGQAAIKRDRVQQNRGVLRQHGGGQKRGGQKQRDAHRYVFPCGRDL